MTNKAILISIEEGDRLGGHLNQIRKELTNNPRTIIILDDDPTGTQTVYDIPVITTWTEKVLEQELLASPVFFVLTNSRSMQTDAAKRLGKIIGDRLRRLAAKHAKKLLLISRSDSTLRGHYPDEVQGLLAGLGWQSAKHLLIPAFFEGGRYTYRDVHYVREKNKFIPAAKTPFAKDNTFGYSSSNLREWIIEKYARAVDAENVSSLSIEELRNNSLADIRKSLADRAISHFAINATSAADLEKLALACLTGKELFIFRTGASFVNAITGIAPKPCLNKKEVIGSKDSEYASRGALIIVGSYVPKSTSQLNFLKNNSLAHFLEMKVRNVFDQTLFKKEITLLSKQVDQLLQSNQDVVLYTSRTVMKGRSKAQSLEIVNLVSTGIITIIKRIKTRPKYLLAKGGITSSDIACKGLSVQRAMVLGQIVKGVPVWQLGSEAKFPGLPYIVFPGNVGDDESLYTVTKLLA